MNFNLFYSISLVMFMFSIHHVLMENRFHRNWLTHSLDHVRVPDGSISPVTWFRLTTQYLIRADGDVVSKYNHTQRNAVWSDCERWVRGWCRKLSMPNYRSLSLTCHSSRRFIYVSRPNRLSFERNVFHDQCCVNSSLSWWPSTAPFMWFIECPVEYTVRTFSLMQFRRRSADDDVDDTNSNYSFKSKKKRKRI